MAARSIARLLMDGPATGAWNMAVDEVLLARAQQGEMTLRFYRWAPATLSLGYFQTYRDREAHEASRNCPVVRRTTGGGAILHDQELTYSISLPYRSQFATSERIYDAFHDSLVELLVAKDIPAHRCQGTDPARESNFLCFARRARGDVLLGPWKVAGSAQRRRGNAVMQHGSILLASSAYAPELPGLRELTNCGVAANPLVNDWVRLLEDKLGASFRLASLGDSELCGVEDLIETRYSSRHWLERR